MTATVNSHQAARMLHFLRQARARLVGDLNDATPGETRELSRDLAALDRLLAEVGPIINPVSPEPAGMRNSRGHVD